jgi:hypothetical protein
MLWICELDLLTTYIHYSELQVVTTLLLISTIHRSPQHTLSSFPACYVFNNRSLATASNSGDFSAFRTHGVSVRRISRNWTLTHFTSLHSTEVLTTLNSGIRIRVTLRLAVYHQSVRLGDKPLETHDQIFLFSNWTLGVTVFMEHSLWREDGCVIYNCCWPSPTQSFPGPSPPWLMTTFYCLRFETPPTWRARSPYLYTPGTRWPGYTPRHWVPFSSPPTTRRANVEVFFSASTRETPSPTQDRIYKPSTA